LQEIAKKDGINKLEPWDVGLPGKVTGYYGEKLKQKKFGISQEDLRDYFPAPHVIHGIFDIIKRLYGITLKENKNVSVWHKDVKFFEVYDYENNLLGYLYLDLYYRDYKSGGAWQDETAHKRYIDKTGKLNLPATYLCCNFSPPVGDKPSLLTHEELLTLLHEMGHCLQHLLTKIDYLGVSCTDGVPLDAVEVASQFMENWGWQKDSLALLSKHYKKGVPLPTIMVEKLLSTRRFQSGMKTLRQLELSLTDFKLHQKQAITMEEIEQLITDIQKQIRVAPTYKHDRFLHAFLHPFVHGYEAGYYSYLWANIASSDLFSKFEEQGIFDQNLGREFLHIFLEAGGSEDPTVLFKRFLGRDIKMDAFPDFEHKVS